MFGGALQPMHLILILVIVLILFGPGKLPELGGSLGRSLSEFKKSIGGGSEPEQPSGDAQVKAKAAPVPGVCGHCQYENPAGNQFCGRCGEKLG